MKKLPLFLCCIAIGISAQAQVTTWTGAASGNWNTAANWSLNAIPNSTSTDVMFNSTGANSTLNLSAATSIRLMYLYGGNYTLSPTASEVLTMGALAGANSGGFVQMGSGTFSVNNSIAMGYPLLFTGTGTGGITLNGAVSSTAGAWGLWKYNTSNLTFTNTYTTNTATTTETIQAGAVILSGGGNFVLSNATSTISLGASFLYKSGLYTDTSGTALILDNTGTNNANRIADTATNKLTFSQRGLFEFLGNASAASSETLGILNVSNAATRIRVASGAGQTAQVTFASLQVNGGVNTNTDNLSSMQFLVPTGGTLGAAGATGSRVIFTTAPTLTNGVLRYGIVKDESVGGSATFATYDSTVDNGGALGVKGLTTWTTTNLNAATAGTESVDASGSITLNGTKSVSALRITATGAGQSLSLGSYTLNLPSNGASGVILDGGYNYSINSTGGSGITTSVNAAYFYINSNSTLTINSAFSKSGALSKAGDGLLVVNGAFSNVTQNRNLSVDKGSVNADDMQIAGAISGTVNSFYKEGLGVLALTGLGDNSGYTVGMGLTAGTLVLAKDSDAMQSNALGTGTFSLAGGTLAARGRAATLSNTVSLGSTSGGQISGDQAITFTGTVMGSQTSGQIYYFINNASANVTMSGTVQAFSANPASALTGTLEFSGSGTTIISGNLTNVGANGTTQINKSGSGLLVLSGSANTYNGTTTVNAGYLRLDNTNVLSTAKLVVAEQAYAAGENAVIELGAGNGNFTRSTGTGAGQIQLGGSGTGNAGFASVSGTSIVNLGAAGAALTWGTSSFFSSAGGALILGSPNVAGTVDFQNAINLGGNRTITALNGSAAVDGIISGVIANGTGTNSVTKNGAGTLQLNAANTYSGGTYVTAGGLIISGSAASAATVSSGAVLGGTGTINGAVTVQDGGSLLAGAGAASGTLTLNNNLTMGSGALDNTALVFALGASVHSTLARTGAGTWTFDTNQKVSFLDLGATAGTTSEILISPIEVPEAT
ncbi:MAG: autotransporter-associated beta strand repeat-containing protein [Verrucomicrobiae bacterium]